MKILIIEDDKDKSNEISDLIKTILPTDSFTIEFGVAINDAILALGRDTFDLVIADLVLPQIRGSRDTCDATLQWLDFIQSERAVRLSTWIVMTSYTSIVGTARESFSRHGVAVIEYEVDGYWRQVLKARLLEHYVNRPLDFVVICALAKERRGFDGVTGVELGDYSSIAGLDCRAAMLGRFRGTLIALSEPGLVSAAIATIKATSIFKPRVVAMSGICGGMIGESNLGDIITPDVAWNYQTGKIVRGELRPELMQTPVPPKIKTLIQQLATETQSALLRTGLFHSELKHRDIHVTAMVSGSPVIADENEALKIATQSRKIGGLDMEVSAVFAAAHDFFNGGGAFFASKVVVDLATEEKDDRYHEYGCALAARYTVTAILAILSEKTTDLKISA